jgi:hypothetical protein
VAYNSSGLRKLDIQIDGTDAETRLKPVLRSIRKFVWPHRERLLSLVMLPAFFLASLPHTACICADGHREPFCRAGACHAVASGSSATARCGCNCRQAGGSTQKRDCCEQEACEPKERDGVPADGLVAKSGPCCQPFVEAPIPAIKASKVEQPLRDGLVAFVQSLHPPLHTANDHPSIDLLHSSKPPPLDAVILFQRLTI